MMFRSKFGLTLAALFVLIGAPAPSPAQEAPFRIGVAGLVHGHVGGFFNQALKRPDVQIVGIAEPDRALFDRYAARYKLNANLYYPSLDALLKAAHPDGIVLYTSTFGHRAAVETCSRNHMPVMMEKPLAVSYQDALAMADAARTGHIHVLVNYETTWYASNRQLKDLLNEGQLGELHKMVFRDGHQGPREIHVQPEFFQWLTDPKLNGAGALFDFGCYGADIGTWLMNGQEPVSVTAVTRRIKPSIYPRVDDEADVIVAYPKAIAILQGSWNWPYAIKDGVVYGTTASAQTILRDKVSIQREHQTAPDIRDSKPLEAPEDDNLHLFAAIVRNRIPDNDNSLSGLKTNLIVSEILDAARQSAETGRTIQLPLK
ncbi:MAG TPA: Gfo/Idh/MocA family oxidoreductase [Bryobacteraceae bacterium]|nr:Gfo/Idh/MocA family oxidoreductase [Bryobacteraceae bacterium]